MISPEKRALLSALNLTHAVVCDHDMGIRSRGAIEGAFYLRSDAEACVERLNNMYEPLGKGSFIIVEVS